MSTKKPSRPAEVDTVESVRQGLIDLRGTSFKHWPDAINATVLLSHAIALLGYLAELEKFVDNPEPPGV